MCHVSCIVFGALNLTKTNVEGKRVIELGSFDENGSLRSIVESLNPAEYIGIDLNDGPGVDEICAAEDVLDKYGNESFDLVLSTEMLEHIRDWKKVISNMKNICKKEGVILLTTRSKGFVYHPTPTDFWRFDKNDLACIFSDCEILALETDKEFPGVFIKVRKPKNFEEKDLSDYKLYSIITNIRTKEIKDADFKSWHYIKLNLKDKIKRSLIRLSQFIGIE